ncbi:MAG: alkaline phosphatase D family protein, partial [Limisphaerales bacterium]
TTQPLVVNFSSDMVSPDSVTKIAFGSCNNPARMKVDQSIYPAILEQQPDLFLFIGDNIYGDTTDVNIFKKKYQALANLPGCQQLQAQTKVLATWDDHDYGINDGGKSYSKREASQQLFLDFFNEPKDSVRRTRPGIYTSYSYGRKGQVVQIILLDTRYFRDELPKYKGEQKAGTVGWYEPSKDSTKTLLGADQWQWLEEQLQVEADVRILASSIQILAYEKGMENWGNVPHEQQRLFDLLIKYRAHHTVAISGDVHFTELSKVMIGEYPFYDLTSSGMTHANSKWAKAKNSFRVGKSHPQLNAGLIEIDWQNSQLTLSSFNTKGEKLIEHPISLSDLEFPVE